MDDDKGGAGSFEQRLAAARAKQGLDTRPDTTGQPGAGPLQGNALGVGVRVGVELVSALAVAVAIGWWLDRWLHTSPLMLVVFVFLGGAAGVANLWRLMGPRATRR